MSLYDETGGYDLNSHNGTAHVFPTTPRCPSHSAIKAEEVKSNANEVKSSGESQGMLRLQPGTALKLNLSIP